MAFPPEFLDELRNRVSIANVVGRRVRLAKKGREHSGLCPFHNEKSPSFTVSEDKGFFHCFGCGAHGDVIGFVMRSEGLAFPEAIEKLAGEAGLQVPEMRPGDRERAKVEAGMAEALEAAAKWFESQLDTSLGAAARRYIDGRGLTPATVTRFRLGYAPSKRTALKDAMIARGFTDAVLVEAGLLIKPDDGGESFDRFRDRIMYPIGDRRGRIIAFGARAMGDIQPKYLNSPETPLFHKGRNLYNLSNAREAARAAGTVIVVEGYMDVIAMAQAGFDHAVAPLGTALTEEQMSELWRIAAEPILCFDGDAAGQRAAYRAAENALALLEPGRSFRFAILPGGLDPDDLIKLQGKAAMEGVLAGAQPLAEILWRKEMAGRPIDTPERRAAIEAAFGQVSDAIRNKSVQGHYRQHFRDRLRQAFDAARPSSISRTYNVRSGSNFSGPAGQNGNFRSGNGSFGGRPGNRPGPDPTLRLPGGGRERALVGAVLNHPSLLDEYEELFAGLHLASAQLDSIRQAVLEEHLRNPGLDGDTLRHHLTDRGFGAEIGQLAGGDTARLHRFVRVDTGFSDVVKGWREACKRHHHEALRAELKEAEEALAADTRPETAMRVKVLREQLNSGNGTEADLD